MFKNCCGCPGKRTNRKESEEDEDEDEKKEKETDNRINDVIEQKIEETAKIIAQKDLAEEVSKKIVEKTTTTAVEDFPRKPSSMKKPKPRLSISTEVKIIPSNFPEELEDFHVEEVEVPKDRPKDVEEEEEEEEEETTKINVKDIDGKIIRKSISEDDSEKPSPEPEPEPEPRTLSPLSDEVFVANEKSHLELPLHNLGVKVEQPLPLPLDKESPKKLSPAYAQKRVSMPAVLPKWLSEEDETGGSQEPPATPVARDELALRRHRFFSELLTIAQAATEHKVRFDPFGPTVELLSETDQGSTQAQAKELENLINRLESITTRLEKTVPLLEKGAEAFTGNIVVTKSLEDFLDEHLTPTEKENLNLLINSQSSCPEGEVKEDSEEKDGFIIISPDSSADFDELSDKDILLTEEDRLPQEIDKILSNNASDKSENSSNSQNTVVSRLALEEKKKAEEEEKTKEEGKKKKVEEEKRKEEEGKKKEEEEKDKKKAEEEEKTKEEGRKKKVEEEKRKEEEEKEEEEKDKKKAEEEGKKKKVSDEVKEEAKDRRVNNSEKKEMTNNQSTLSMSVQGFQHVLQGPFASYLQISSLIGGDVAEHAKIVQEAFHAQLQYLSLAAQSSKPPQTEEVKLLQPTSQSIEAIQTYREKHRTSNYFNHLSAVSESVPALGWVTVSPAPAPYVKEMNDAGQFYTNRVLKEWKEKDKIHVEWTKAWIQTLSELQAFVKQYHTTGLVWGGNTGPRLGGIPPPPPPGGLPPPPPMLDLGDVAPSGPEQDRSALFAQINQGENITRNLKKVTAEMQTHKNPSIRAGPAPFKGPPSSITSQSPKPFTVSSQQDKPPKFAREGKKWFIEYQKGNHQLIVDNAEMNNVVYVFKCTDSTLVVKGKVNSIFLDSCRKTAVVFDSVVSSIEFVNCQSVQMQVLGTVPTISIDKTDGCQMYLSQDSLNVEIVSSKSSEMNVLVPTGAGDFKELPVPEQFKTMVSRQGLTTTPVENKG